MRGPHLGWVVLAFLGSVVGNSGLARAGEAPAAWEAGRELFTRVWEPRDRRSRGGDGLGPVFNAQSCVACHDQGGLGGAGGLARNIEIATVTGPDFPGYAFQYAFAMDFGTGRFEYRLGPGAADRKKIADVDPRLAETVHPGFRSARSVVLHRFGTDPGYQAWRSGVPGSHGLVNVVTSERNPTPLFGTGLIDSIPDSVIEAGASRNKVGVSSRVRGRVSRLPDGRVGRFGWKAQTATLREFVLGAAATEMGLELPGRPQAADPRLPGLGGPGLDMTAADVEALVAFVRALPAPVSSAAAGDDAAAVRAGEAAFHSIGCAVCHTPRLGDVEGVYSDLLLHDMSPRLGDTAAYGVFVASAPAAGARGERAPGAATTGEWRTPPLWGLRDSAPYLHDGRATSVDDAIALHGGQGAVSAQKFAQLSARKKAQLLAFLQSLTAPTP